MSWAGLQKLKNDGVRVLQGQDTEIEVTSRRLGDLHVAKCGVGQQTELEVVREAEAKKGVQQKLSIKKAALV